MREYVLFDNYNGYDFDEVKAEYGEDTPDEIIYMMFSESESEHWDNAKRELEDDLEDYPALLVVGTCGRWDGTFAGGEVCKDLDEVFNKVFKDCTYRKVWYKKGHLYVMGSHHDGTNEYEVKPVTEAGYKYYENWSLNYGPTKNLSEREIHRRMFRCSKYTHLA